MKKDSLTEIMVPVEKQFSRRTLLAPKIHMKRKIFIGSK